jgi:hypothetical protein
MDYLPQFAVTLFLSAIVIWLLTRSPFRRLPQGLVLVLGAIAVGLIALVVFFGAYGGGFGLMCGGAVVVAGAVLYLLLWLMERWAQGGGDGD